MISMGTVWDRTAEFLSDNLGTILPIALLAILVPSAVSGSLAGLQAGATPGLLATLGLVSLALGLVSFWGQLAITALALDPMTGRHAVRVATRRFPAALLVMLILLAGALLLTLPLGIIMAASGMDLTAASAGAVPEPPAGAGGAIGLYLLVVLPLLIWVMTRLSVCLPVVVGEALAVRALPRTWRLTRGAALRIFGVMLLYVIVASVAYLAATTAFGAVITLIAGRGEDGISLAGVLTNIVGGAVSTGFTVLGTAFVAKLYLALAARHQAVAA